MKRKTTAFRETIRMHACYDLNVSRNVSTEKQFQFQLQRNFSLYSLNFILFLNFF